MSDCEFKTYDKAPLVGGTFTLGFWRLGVREFILGLLATVFLIVVIVLAALAGWYSGQVDDAKAQTAQLKANACNDAACLHTVAGIMFQMNESVNPCDNFYQFACGRFPQVHPLTHSNPWRLSYDTLLQDFVDDQLTEILENPSRTSWASENKMKDFYKSCMDDYQVEAVDGYPILVHIVPKLGSTYLQDPGWMSSAASWDLNKALRFVQVDLEVPVFYNIDLETTTVYGDIEIEEPDTSENNGMDAYEENKIKMMTSLANLLKRDFNLTDENVTTRLQTFVNDAFEMEQQLINITRKASYRGRNNVTLKLLGDRPVNWTDLVWYQLSEIQPITPNTPVWVYPDLNFYTNLTAWLSGLYEKDNATASRKLNNYLLFRVVEQFVDRLSSNYKKVSQQFQQDMWGRDWGPNDRPCLYETMTYFHAVLGAVYIRDKFPTKHRNKVADIAKAVEEELRTSFKSTKKWDKETADKLVNETSHKIVIGYLPGIDSLPHEFFDQLYQNLIINSTDYFGNYLELLKQRRYETLHLPPNYRRYELFLDTYSVYPRFDHDGTIFVPAGMLTSHWLSVDQLPHYFSFGQLGKQLAFWQIVNLIRSIFNLRMMPQTFKELEDCIDKRYTFRFANYTEAKNNLRYHWYKLYSDNAALQLAYNAYQTWQQTHGADPDPPGLKYNQQQLFFVSYAQTFCYTNDLFKSDDTIGPETSVNVAMAEFTKFQDAFSCKAGDTMVSNATERCSYY